MAINGVGSWIREQEGEDMEWARTLAYITGTVDQELLLRNEYLDGGPNLDYEWIPPEQSAHITKAILLDLKANGFQIVKKA
jgi:hypothetical protein